MRDATLEQALSSFLAAPERGVDELLSAFGPFVMDQARFWQRSSLTFTDRCREILTELFLILIEDIRVEKVNRPESVLSYLNLRLRRLTRPAQSRTTPFGLADDLPDSGRCGFTPLRLEIVRELAECTRSALVNDPHEATRLLEFLFIHIAPDLASASRFLAVAAGAEAESRIEADKKRHQAFTRQLRSRFESMKSGDWRDVSNWSGGERSHLAWRLISFTRHERSTMGELLAAALEEWRDDQQPYRHEESRAALVAPAIGSLAGLYPPRASTSPHAASEAAAAYGEATDFDPLLLLLVPNRPFSVGTAGYRPVNLRQEAGSYAVEKPSVADGAENGESAAQAYLEAADAVRSWFASVADTLGRR
ncbi:MAG TPA: hypothetical protein PLU72_10165 [Candidatus Ozemobacteraceae bacterium]|nr:hypothetical protein [Candidatus Ozemobacteraceae bacterium]HQG27141.1 hypothetical protein [Candidatus Ozemobacteraceae bacterium]